MRAHADTHDRDLGDFVVGDDFAGAHGGCDLAGQQSKCAGELIAVNRKGKVGRTGHGLVLHDHVDVDVGVSDFTQDCVCDAWLVGHAQQSNLGFVAAKGDARDNSCFHFFVFLKSNQGAGAHFLVQRHVGVGQ